MAVDFTLDIILKTCITNKVGEQGLGIESIAGGPGCSGVGGVGGVCGQVERKVFGGDWTQPSQTHEINWAGGVTLDSSLC